MSDNSAGSYAFGTFDENQETKITNGVCSRETEILLKNRQGKG